ncbi:hypothetical protein FSC774_03990 [Francisella noatunensis subsp. noatunensis FSC774]|nr:hypothetical protein FSC774_03990 [Francisella noatunensis subsp. noatunensis FSC774]
MLDVDNYKNFIPMCYEAELLEKTSVSQKALIKLKIPLLKVEVITDYKTIDDNNIEVSMQGCPFKIMQGYWEFKKIDDKLSQVKLTSKYSFKKLDCILNVYRDTKMYFIRCQVI